MSDNSIPIIIKEIKKNFGIASFRILVEDRRPDLMDASEEVAKLGYKYKTQFWLRIFWYRIAFIVRSKYQPYISINRKEI